MAPKVKQTQQNIKQQLRAQDIKESNAIRKAQGPKYASLPVKNNQWLQRVESYTLRRYGPANAQFATKAISLRISRYQADRLNNMTQAQANTYLNSIVKKESFWGTSLESVIKSGNVQAYGSDTINQLADADDGNTIDNFKARKTIWQEYLKNGKLKSL